MVPSGGQWLFARPAPPLGRPDAEDVTPYARTLPCTVCSPLRAGGWRRTELALLARCIPGTPALQKVAARTMQLALELGALVDAGLLWRFPDSSPRAR